ncbi:hypothetical protein L0F63_005712 [Massospora cicadina]|nr:hypothetical protein L0F63_005712 [Massospora cicadina]
MSRGYFGPGRDRRYSDCEYAEESYALAPPRANFAAAVPGVGRGRSRSVSRSSSRSRSLGAYDRVSSRRDLYEGSYSPYRYGHYPYYDNQGAYSRDLSRTPSPVAHYPGLSHPPNEDPRYERFRHRERRVGFAHAWDTRPSYHRPYYDDSPPRGRRYSPDSYYPPRSRSPYDYFGRDAYPRHHRSPTPPRGEYQRGASRERRYYDSSQDRSPSYPPRDRYWERSGPHRRERSRGHRRFGNSPPPITQRRRTDPGARCQVSEGEVGSKSSQQPSTKSTTPCGSKVPSPDRASGEPDQRPDQPPPPTTPVPAPPPAQAPPPPATRSVPYYPMPPQFQRPYSQLPPYYVRGRDSFPPPASQGHPFPPRAPPQPPPTWASRDSPRDLGYLQPPDLPFHIQYRANPPCNRPPRYAPSSATLGWGPLNRPRTRGFTGDSQPLLLTAASPHRPSPAQQAGLATKAPHPRPRPPPTTNRRSSTTNLKPAPKPDFLIQFEAGLYPHPWPSRLDEEFMERAYELRRLRASEAAMRAALARSKFDLLLTSLEVERLELALDARASEA